MQNHDIIVVGSSAGGLKPLLSLVGGLSPRTEASIFVLRHFPPEEHSDLPSLLTCNGPIMATEALDGEVIRSGHIYVAPAGQQLVLGLTRMALEQPLSRNYFRPTIDALFISAADIFSLRVIGIILSGLMGDGAKGLLAIKLAGGVSIVQQPTDAEYKGMPESALRLRSADYVLPAADMGPVISTLVK